MVHETSEINYYMGQNEPHGKPRLHTVTARVDKVLFPEGSDLESSGQLLTTEDLTTLAAQLSTGLTVTQIAGGASYATSEDLSTLEGRVDTLAAATKTPQSAHTTLKGRVDTLAAATNTPQSEHNTLKVRVDTLDAATNTPQSEHESLLARVAASELKNTALILQLQSTIDLLSAGILQNRAAFDSLAERQLANSNGDYGWYADSESQLFAGYFIDNDIPVPVFSWPWTPRRYTTYTNDDGQRLMAIETFTDDEQNYNAGDRILITGITVTSGPFFDIEDSTLINSVREVNGSVSLEFSSEGYSYLIVLLSDFVSTHGAGLIAGGASWVSAPLDEYIYASTIFAIWAHQSSDLVALISMDKNWTSLYGETIIVSGDVQVGGETLVIHGERIAYDIPATLHESLNTFYGFEIVRGFVIIADSPATATALVMTPYGNPSTNLHIKSKSEIPRIPHAV